MINSKLIPVVFLTSVYTMFGFSMHPEDNHPSSSKSMPDLRENKQPDTEIPPPYTTLHLSVEMPDHSATQDFKRSQCLEKKESEKRLSKATVNLQALWTEATTLCINDDKLSYLQKSEQVNKLAEVFSSLQMASLHKDTPPPPQADNLEKSEGLERLKKRIEEQDTRIQCLECVSYDGRLLWKIKDYNKRKKEAMDGEVISLYSQPFYSPDGYKMCGRVYLNGDGMGKGTHLSLFFTVMQGEKDALLPWPFSKTITMRLIDQKEGKKDLIDTFSPDPKNSSFFQPTEEMNTASGCPLFASHSVVETDRYLVGDTLYISIQVSDKKSNSSLQPQDSTPRLQYNKTKAKGNDDCCTIL